MNNLANIIPLISIIVYFIVLKINSFKWSNPFIVVFLVYFMSSVSSIFVNEKVLRFFFDFSKYTYFHFIIYSFFLTILLVPIFFLRNLKIDLHCFKITKPILYFYIFTGLGAIYSIFYQLPYAIKSFSLGAQDVRYLLNVEKESVLPESILTTVAVAISSFYVIYIFMFYVAIVRKLPPFYKITSFIGSISYIVSSICFTARDGAVFFILTMTFGYLLIKDNLNSKSITKLFKIVIIFVTIIIFIFISFTIQRFGKAQNNLSVNERLVVGTVSYIGQQPYVFAENIVQRKEYYGLSMRFPLITKLLGIHKEINRTKVYEWSFGSIIKDFYDVNGWSSLIILSATFSGVFSYFFFFHKKYHPLRLLIGISLYFHLVISGIFYFRYGTWAGNIYIVLVILLIIISRLGLSNRKIMEYNYDL